MIPKDPVMLLSYVNTQLRDKEGSLKSLCETQDIEEKALVEKMEGIGYHYDEKINQFTASDSLT